MNNLFNSFYLLGVRIDEVNFKEAIEYVFSLVRKKKRAIVVTPNPEIILLAQEDNELRRIINQSELSVSDGVGVVWASRFLGLGKNSHVVKGRYLASKIVSICALKNIKTALVGDGAGSAIKTAKKFRNEHIKGFIGPMLLSNGLPQTKSEEKKEQLLLKQLKRFSPQIILVGFGCPKQEKWLNRILPKIDNAVGMVVGGTFDYMSGKVPLPPKHFEKFEWFWRLLMQPKRMPRILNAIVVFPFCVIARKFLRH